MKLYIFRTVRLSIIRGLFTVHSAMLCVICRARPSWSCSKAVYKPVWHTPLLSVRWINSWWWTDEMSETCRVSWLLLLPLALQPTVRFGLSNNILPFFPITNSLHLLTPSTWKSLSTSSFHSFPGLPLRLVPSSSLVKIFLVILSSSILSRWPNQLILCTFIHFTIFSPLLIYSSSRFVLLFHSPFSYLGPHILLNIFLSKTRRACSSFFVTVHSSAPYETTGQSFMTTQICKIGTRSWFCYKEISINFR